MLKKLKEIIKKLLSLFLVVEDYLVFEINDVVINIHKKDFVENKKEIIEQMYYEFEMQ